MGQTQIEVPRSRFFTPGDWGPSEETETSKGTALGEQDLLKMYQNKEIDWAKFCALMGVGVTDKITIGNVTFVGD